MKPKSMNCVRRLNRRNFDLSIFHSFKFDGVLGCMEGGNKQDFVSKIMPARPKILDMGPI